MRMKTVKIETEAGGSAIINEADFDPGVHKLQREKLGGEEPGDPEDTGSEDVPEVGGAKKAKKIKAKAKAKA